MKRPKPIPPLYWFLLLALLALPLAPSHGQTSGANSAQLVITAVTAETLPFITLRAYGRHADGSPINLATEPLTITHGGQTIPTPPQRTTSEIGTLTIFLVDTPAGTEPALPAIQSAIEQYASPSYMQEAGTAAVDYVAIYQVEATRPEQLLAPSEYYNSVRNLFVDPLPIEAGPTALVDSLMALLNNVDNLRPNPAQFATIVVFSDGTDVVSTQFQAADVPRRAAELGIPIHTVLLDNTPFGNSVRGTEFMAQLASNTGGVAVRLSQPQNLPTIWNRITPFRTQTTLTYEAPLQGGDFPVQLSLTAAPQVQATTQVRLSPTAPYALLDVPAESRTLVLPDLLSAVALRLPVTVGWVDGTTRQLSRAELWVNGQLTAELAPDQLTTGEITVALGNLNFGQNHIELALADELAQRATSPPLVLTVQLGDTAEIPPLLQPATPRLGGWGSYLRGCLLLLLLLLGLGLAWWRGWLATKPRRTQVTITGGTPAPNGQGEAPTGTFHAVRQPTFRLEVISSQTVLPAHLPLTAVEMRLGRSASEANLIFAADPTVSRLHASMVREGNSYRLFDEQSTSGTFVNHQPIPAYGALLIDGDEIQIGEVQLRFRMAIN